MIDRCFKINTNIFQEKTRKIEFESLLKYINENNIKDINIIKKLLIKSINVSIEEINKLEKELNNLL